MPLPSRDLGGEDSSVPSEGFNVFGSLLYGLSVPERTLRSLSAIVGGLAGETATLLIPAAFRSSRSYSTFIQQSLDFMTRDVGGVAQPAQPGDAAAGGADASAPAGQAEDFLARKAVGGLLEIASMSTLHLSPVTVLAIFSDLAYGSGHLLKELTVELKKQGIIDQESTVDHVSDFVTALSEASGQTVQSLDCPPINVAGLQQTIEQTRQALGRIDPAQLLPQSEINRLWAEMEATANEAEVGLLDVSATMTMFAMNRLSLATRGALSSVTVAGNLFDQHVLQHYIDGLAAIHAEGLYATLRTASSPYVEAVWRNYEAERETWTEELLSGRLAGRTWTTVWNWLSPPRE
ncbi:hypothetical protein [Candidatus Laterigemmans baculatus]|uniref:hypothetical protein n=1 Tax=Candidatus Laterigemmans baculatus TaxID=2770505 RepID=UPI0013D8FE12|nr:hypothetical protein [Candidatus Laterigemmans baculatus]